MFKSLSFRIHPPNKIYKPLCCYSSSVLNLFKNNKLGEYVEIKGWVKSLRNQKENVFVDLTDGSTNRKLQVLIPKSVKSKGLSTGSSLTVKGVLSSTPRGDVEVKAEHIEVWGQCVVSEGYPFAPRKEYAPEYIRQYLHFRPRTNRFSSLLRVRSRATLAIHEHFESEGFINVHTPILTSNDCENAGEVFKVVPDNDALIKSMERPDLAADAVYFGTKTYLTVSGQLHLEAVTHGLSKVYTLGPTFRAENSRSRLHLSEFYMLEAELAFLTKLEELIAVIEKLVKSVTSRVLDESKEDIDNITGDGSCDFSWLNKKFPIISYEEAVSVVRNSQELSKDPFYEEKGFSKEHEIFLVKHFGNVPLFVINWPKVNKPFYMKECDGDPTKVCALDLLAPNVGEIVGGSLREDNYEKLKAKLPDGPHLDWYVELRKFGGVPTGGFGLGFERYLQFILGIPNIKDTIPFPRWPHNCSL